MLADEIRQFKTVDLRHTDIHEDDGNVGFEQVLQGLPARTGLDQVLP
jgi:hypothetical protein